MSKIIENFINYVEEAFKKSSFKIGKGKLSENFKASLWAENNTPLLGGLSHARDFYFFHNVENDYFRNESKLMMEKIKNFHEKAKQYGNSFYKIPKAFRLGIPTVNTIIISEHAFEAEVKELAKENTRTMVGGEYNQIFLLDLHAKELSSQGISRTWLVGMPGSIQRHMEFKQIDPQNRGFYIIDKICNGFYKTQ